MAEGPRLDPPSGGLGPGRRCRPRPLLTVHRTGSAVAVLGGYIGLTVLLTYPVAPGLASHVPIAHQIPGWMPGDGDPWQTLWGFWFVRHFLLESWPLPFHTDMLFYPLGIDLTVLLLIVVPLFVAVALVGLLGLVVTYNVMIIGSLAFAAYAMFLLANRVVKHRGAAFVSGVIFAFSPYQMVHSIEHLFLVVSAVWIPLYVLFLLRTLDDGGIANVTWAAVWMVCTVFSNPYYAIFLIIFTALLLLHSLWEAKSAANRMRVTGRVISIAALAALVVIPVASSLLYRWSADTVLATPLADVNEWNADLLAFFVPSPLHPLWGAFVEPLYQRFTGNLFEQTVYMGIVVITLATVAVVKSSRQARIWAGSALVFFVLALGPFLHIMGVDTFNMGDRRISIPLPGLLFHYIPVLSAIRVASRFDVMLMLCLAVLAGQGLALLAARRDARPRVWMQGRGLIALATVAVLGDFVSAPLPVLDARVPAVYAEIARERLRVGTVLDVPLDWKIAKYQYHQTVHGQRLVMGFVPRPSDELVRAVDLVPFAPLFLEPARIGELQAPPGDRQDAMRLVDLFDLSAIVIHRDYVSSSISDRLTQFVGETFPVERVIRESGVVALLLRRDHDSVALWQKPGAYRLEFGPGGQGFFLTKGWWLPEANGDVGFAWSKGSESTLAFYLPRTWPMTLELTLLPFSSPSLPQQGITIYANNLVVRELMLEHGWQTYALALPASALKTGVNVMRFRYRFAVPPAAVVPDSKDMRPLAVAFDRLELKLRSSSMSSGH